MVGDRSEQRPATGLTLQQRVGIEERFGSLPPGGKLDPGNTQVTGMGKRLGQSRQSRGLSEEPDLHARSFPSAPAGSPETGDGHDSTACGDTNNTPQSCQQSANADLRSMMSL